jgi:phage repressor protein C with HTH and peptisase S24 domain
MSLGEIIRKKREELDLTLDEVSGKSGFSKPYLSTIETGKVKNPPSDKLLRKLEKILRFEPGLLLHIAHMDRVPPDIRNKYEIAEAENKKWRNLIKNLITQKTPETTIDDLLAESNLDVKHLSSPLPTGQLVPIINKVSAGYPSDFDDLDYPVGAANDYLRCPDLHDPNAFAIRVVGDSMEPKFHQGDIVILSPAAEVRSGDDCFVRLISPNGTDFKRVFFEPENKLRLQPRNDKYPPEIIGGKHIGGLYKAIVKYEKL